jgi:amidase
MYIPQGGYKKFLKIDGLKGKRIGVLNGLFHFEDRTTRQMVYRQHIYTME